MPLLKKPILLPVEGVNYSAPSTMINDRAGFPQNMRFYRNELIKREGSELYGATATGDTTQIMGLGRLELNSSEKYLVRASKANIEKYNTGTSDWVSIAATALTGGDDDQVNFTDCSEEGFLIITNGLDKIRKWTGTGNVSALGGNPPLAKYCTYLSPYLILAHIDDGTTISPWKVQWPDTGNSEVWTGGNSGSLLVADEPSPIKNIAKLNEYVAVYKRESLWLLRKVAYSDIFSKECVKSGMGLAASRAFADVDGMHYFMGLNDFYVWNGGIPESIGFAVRDEVFSKIERSKINRCFAVHIRQFNEVWFYIVVSGQSWPTEIWKYNYKNGFWYYDTCDEITAIITWEKTAVDTWNDQTLTWDNSLIRWDNAITTADWEEVVFGKSNGYCYKINQNLANDYGSAVSSYYQSIDFCADQFERYKRWLQIDVWARGSSGAKLYVDYSTDFGSSWTNIPYSSSVAYITLTEVTTKFEMYFDIVAENIRYKFRNAESGEIFYLRQFYPYYLSREEKRS